MILIAGASGAIGFECLRLSRHWVAPVRTISRNPSSLARLREFASDTRIADATVPGALQGICDGVHTVISCLGAPVDPNAGERRSYFTVDAAANTALVREAAHAGVRRFLYVGVHVEPAYASTAYVRAHEEVVRQLGASGIHYTVIRPTGVFSALAGMLDMARRGRLPRIGNGQSRTNPIHESDIAELIGRHLDAGPPEINAGGPEVFTRNRIAELMFEAVGKTPRWIPAPPSALQAVAAVTGLWNPRMAELTRFFGAVATTDCIAPVQGRRRLSDYLANRVNSLRHASVTI